MSETENKREYEMVYFLTPEIAEENVGTEAEEIAKILDENGGKSIRSNPLQLKRLAYPIKKQNQAYFSNILFLSDNDGLEKIKKALEFNKKVLRYLIVNNPPKSATSVTPKPLMPSEAPPVIPMPQTFDQKLESILKS